MWKIFPELFTHASKSWNRKRVIYTNYKQFNNIQSNKTTIMGIEEFNKKRNYFKTIIDQNLCSFFILQTLLHRCMNQDLKSDDTIIEIFLLHFHLYY